MNIYRITKSKYTSDMSGTGSRISGGRWNSRGNPVIYTTSTSALAMLEALANFKSTRAPLNLVLVEYFVPDHIHL